MVQGAAVPETCLLEADIKLDSSIIAADKCLVESISQSEQFIGI